MAFMDYFENITDPRSHINKKHDIHMISVWSCQSRLVLGQSRSAGKKNEIETVMEVLELLELKGTIVTLDAMSCQKKIAEKIKGKGRGQKVSLKSSGSGIPV